MLMSKTITFILKADATFEAKGIDDAFLKLSNYFKEMSEQEETRGTEMLITSGSITISPRI